jgi:threonyl-tRNA synthetase
MLIVGEKEVAERRVSVRKHSHGDQGSVSLDEFIANFVKESASPI